MKKAIILSILILIFLLLYNLRSIYASFPASTKSLIKEYTHNRYQNLGDKSKILIRILNLEPFKNIQRRYGRTNPKIDNLNNDYNVKFLPDTASSKFNLIKHRVKFKEESNFYSWYRSTAPGFYKPFFIELVDDKILLINSDGEILLSNLSKDFLKKKTKLEFSNINHNLEITGTKKNRVTASLVDNKKLYLSHTTLKQDCQKFHIVVANLNFKKLEFKPFFDSDICGVNLHAGKMASLSFNGKKGILFSVGGERLNEASMLPQDPKSDLGKTIFVDFEKKQKIIYSIGHRNAQGIFVDQDIIIATEHGPRGGDEINKILFNKNYGWPLASYGYAYTHNKTKNKDRKYLKDHKSHGFEEPVYSFIPSIGISQIIKIDDNFSENWKGNFLLSSLNGGSLYRIKFSKDFNKVIFIEKIFVNRRIRDLKYSKKLNAVILALEDWKEIGVLKEFKNE